MCVYALKHVGLLRVLTLTVLVSDPATLLAVHEYSVKLSFCSKTKTDESTSPPLMVVYEAEIKDPPENHNEEGVGLPVAGQYSCNMVPGMTDKFCRPAPDTKLVPDIGSDIVVFIVGGSERG